MYRPVALWSCCSRCRPRSQSIGTIRRRPSLLVTAGVICLAAGVRLVQPRDDRFRRSRRSCCWSWSAPASETGLDARAAQGSTPPRSAVIVLTDGSLGRHARDDRGGLLDLHGQPGRIADLRAGARHGRDDRPAGSRRPAAATAARSPSRAWASAPSSQSAPSRSPRHPPWPRRDVVVAGLSLAPIEPARCAPVGALPRGDARPIIPACPSCAAGSIPRAAETRANHDAMAALVDDLRARQAALAAGGAGGDERSIARHRERGKLPVRERIDRLLDPGSSFLELSPLAANRPVRRRCAGCRDRDRDRPRSRARPASSSPTTPRSRAARTTR